MCAWFPFVPVLRYLQVAWHLLKVHRGSEEYNPAFEDRAVKSRELEGLAEAVPQFAFQIMLLAQYLGNVPCRDFYHLNREWPVIAVK